jgi:ubiquinone/menaquinone biosynthesis C-methylase UbiE
MVTDACAVDMNGYPVKRTNQEYARGANRPGGASPRKTTEDSMMPNTELNDKEIKKYYIDIERYDWVTDIKYPEKLFHIWRERGIMKWINRYGKGTTLDVGCGTGLITRHLNGNHIVALDINHWAVKRVKLHASDKVQCVAGDIESLPLASDTFDMVICTDVLEHLPNPDRALKEILRVMKTGAILIGEVPSRNLIWKFRQYLTTTCPVCEPFHHNYSISELKLLLNDFRMTSICRSAFGLELLFIVQKLTPTNKQ